MDYSRFEEFIKGMASIYGPLSGAGLNSSDFPLLSNSSARKPNSIGSSPLTSTRAPAGVQSSGNPNPISPGTSVRNPNSESLLSGIKLKGSPNSSGASVHPEAPHASSSSSQGVSASVEAVDVSVGAVPVEDEGKSSWSSLFPTKRVA